MSAKIAFISYSHDSEAHREKVLKLSERLRADGLESRLDQYVNGTPVEGWPRWMLDQLEAADSVLVICTETYYRRFRGREAPGKGKGVDWEGALITQGIYDARSKTKKFIPALFASEDEPFIPEPLRPYTFYVLTSEESYRALYDALLEQSGVEPGQIGELQERPRRRGTPLRFEGALNTGVPNIAPSRLTHVAEKLFGRETESANLDAAWQDPKIHVVTLVAWGGVGKTSLVAKWAAQLALTNYDGADYFDWSFHSQGTREQGGASSDSFIAEALRFFGDPDLAARVASPWDKGMRLAQLVAQRRTLLILDGLEPLQYPPGPLGGAIKDPAVTALLKGLAAHNRGLCLVTTRESVADLTAFLQTTVQERKLEHLATPAGVALLEQLGVVGQRGELMKLVEEVKGHALTLNLVGRFVRDALGGDIRKRSLVRSAVADSEAPRSYAFRAMEAYEDWFAPKLSLRARVALWLSGKRRQERLDGERQLATLRLLGLFDRPAGADCLEALRRPPRIPGLTDPLVGVSAETWTVTISQLVRCGLVSRQLAVSDGPLDAGALDAHPLIREYFARQIRALNPEGWKMAHGRVFEHLRDTTEYRPDSLEGLQPLYQAVAHGCQAERWPEACDDIYFDRICRRGEFYGMTVLGAFGADLGAVACFFEVPWRRVFSQYREADLAWLLNEAATRLRALGQLSEALEPWQVGIRAAESIEEWENAAVYSSNLSELKLTLGDLSEAAREARESVAFADRSEVPLQRVASRTTLADALHHAGRRDEARLHFVAAEGIRAEVESNRPLLPFLGGFRYCDLLLGQAERAAWRPGSTADGQGSCVEAAREVERRVLTVIGWHGPDDAVLTVALDHLTLGRARLYPSVLEGAAPASSRPEVEQALDGLRRAGQSDETPKGLLTRAWLNHLEGYPEAARADLDAAQEIAERGPMPLYLADAHLYRARLFHDREALAAARELIEKHGYWRRKEELEDAEEWAKGW